MKISLYRVLDLFIFSYPSENEFQVNFAITIQSILIRTHFEIQSDSFRGLYRLLTHGSDTHIFFHGSYNNLDKYFSNTRLVLVIRSVRMWLLIFFLVVLEDT